MYGGRDSKPLYGEGLLYTSLTDSLQSDEQRASSLPTSCLLFLFQVSAFLFEFMFWKAVERKRGDLELLMRSTPAWFSTG